MRARIEKGQTFGTVVCLLPAVIFSVNEHERISDM